MATLVRVNLPVLELIVMPTVAVSRLPNVEPTTEVIEKLLLPVPNVALIAVGKVVSIPTVVA